MRNIKTTNLKNYPSIRSIGNKCNKTNFQFDFAHILPTEVGKQIETLSSNKAKSGKRSTDKLKKMKDLACLYVTDCINSAIYESKFPKELKDADVSPGFKRGVTTTKVNYRPINVLPSVSKILREYRKDKWNAFL